MGGSSHDDDNNQSLYLLISEGNKKNLYGNLRHSLVSYLKQRRTKCIFWGEYKVEWWVLLMSTV